MLFIKASSFAFRPVSLLHSEMKMERLFIMCGILLATAVMLFSESLKIANSIIFKVPEGWSYVDSTQQTMPGLGILTSAHLKNSEGEQQLTVSVLSVGEPVDGIQYSTELIEATLSPLVEAYRKQGSHYYPRKILRRGGYTYYSQEVGHLTAKKVELRGILLKTGDDWVNFFCMSPQEIRWEQYREIITGTKLLKRDTIASK